VIKSFRATSRVSSVWYYYAHDKFEGRKQIELVRNTQYYMKARLCVIISLVRRLWTSNKCKISSNKRKGQTSLSINDL
jgi:hypothetical protein